MEISLEVEGHSLFFLKFLYICMVLSTGPRLEILEECIFLHFSGFRRVQNTGKEYS